MTITILAPGVFSPLTSDEPEVGCRYVLEPDEDGTSRQNRTFHALVQEYWRSGAHSYPAKSFAEFRDMIKRDLGAGFESFVYASPDGVVKVKTREEIPPEFNNKKFAMGRLLSWSDYTKRQRCDTIDRLIAEMMQAEVQTKKFFEILEGMEAKA